MPASNFDYDVAILGGGPGGSTTGSFLKKYRPELKVLILEKEKFPREHVGESQLPQIGRVLEEMGCWDKVEAADFPIKIGGTFRWGKRHELWDFDFLPAQAFRNEPRPAKYSGQRHLTAFQVDRSIYDTILLRHAESLGCEVREETQVGKVLRDGDRVEGFELRDGGFVRAKYYIDASGHAGILRRALDVPVECPTNLQNIAIWDYWENTKWAVHIGVGGTRIQVMSLPYGWIWFIPLGPKRTSLGLVCPAEYYKQSGKTPEELYRDAVAAEPRISALIAGGTRRNIVNTTKDWSFVSQRTFGENWFLVGEAAGFADPILSAGLTLTQVGARELAYTILALERGELDAAWLKKQYDENQLRRVKQHIRFADYWYAANGQFTDLQEHCSKIAEDSGLKLEPAQAWHWLAQGGFTNDILGQAVIGGFDVSSVKQVAQRLTEQPAEWSVSRFNIFRLNLNGVERGTLPHYDNGRIHQVACYERDGKRLPLIGLFDLLLKLLQKAGDAESLMRLLMAEIQRQVPPDQAKAVLNHAMGVLEVLVSEGWVEASLDLTKSRLTLTTPWDGPLIHTNKD